MFESSKTVLARAEVHAQLAHPGKPLDDPPRAPFDTAKNRTNASVVYTRAIDGSSYESITAPRPSYAPREKPVVGEPLFVKRSRTVDGIDQVASIRGVADHLHLHDRVDQPDVLREWNLDGVLRTFDAQ